MKEVLIIIMGIVLLSCKKEKKSEFNFQSCNIETQNTKFLSSQSGTLSYTNVLGKAQLTTYSYYILLNGELPLEVCNMPSSVKLAENETKSISFSGKMVVLSDETDAISTEIELTNLDFK